MLKSQSHCDHQQMAMPPDLGRLYSALLQVYFWGVKSLVKIAIYGFTYLYTTQFLFSANLDFYMGPSFLFKLCNLDAFNMDIDIDVDIHNLNLSSPNAEIHVVCLIMITLKYTKCPVNHIGSAIFNCNNVAYL